MRFPAYLALLTTIAFGCEKSPKPSKVAQTATQIDARPVEGTAQKTEGSSRPLIDTHTHLNPPSFGLFLKLMDDNGIERAVNMSGGSNPEAQVQALRVADQAGGRLALFHNIDWSNIDAPDFGEREATALEASIRRGFAGLKISKALGLGVETEEGELVAVDDPRLDPIWEKAGELGVPVAIHTSDPKAFFEKPGPDNERHAELSLAPSWSFYGDEYPSRAELLAQRDRMIARHRGTTFILLHFANNPEDVDYVDRLLTQNPNAMVDIAARIGEFGRHEPSKVRAIFERHSERILFATDLMLGVHMTPEGQPAYRLTLGSIGEERPTLDDVDRFYELHRRYFERSGAPIDHPVPIQGDWKVHPIGLKGDLLDAVYWKNAERVIFAPWLGRRTAASVAAKANSLQTQ